MNWTHWSLDRILILFVALAFCLIGIQVTMSHYRQNFHHKAMYSPVIEAPIFFLVGLSLAINYADWLAVLFSILMWIGTLTGLAGTYFHFHGVGVRVGGWVGRNFLIGPPVVLPVVYTAVSVLGLIAVYWG